MPQNNPPFDHFFKVSCLFSFYLQTVGLDEKTMHPVQLQETKRAFYGAVGEMLIVFRDDVPKLSQKEQALKLNDMIQQINLFWQNETLKHNGGQG